MNDLNLFAIMLIIFGILQIILFFKLWGMTNDVADIKRIIRKNKKTSQSTVYPTQIQQDTADKTLKDYDVRLDTLKEGDMVEIALSGREVPVMFVEKDRIYCKTSMLGGGEYYSKKELRYIE